MPTTIRLAAALALASSIVGPQRAPGQAPTTGATSSRAPSLFPRGYLGHEALGAALRKAAEANPKRIAVGSLGKSLESRDIWLVTVGAPDPFKPAILIVANLEGDHVIGSQVALRMAERFAVAEGPTAAWLEGVTVYLVPRLNPDGAERSLGLVEKAPLAEFRGNARALDRDRDGKLAEDSPDDLDGDGVIATLRHKNADEGPLTLVPDADGPRVLRKADAAKGERGTFAEVPEGRDDDGDGLINEDPASGVNLGRNWPHRWTEFSPETGFSPASEPETLALIRFAFQHPEIAAVWEFGLRDSLRNEPKKPASTLDDADLPLFAELAKSYQKATSAPADDKPKDGTPPAKPPAEAPTDGSLGEWAYHQFGVVGLSSRLWSVPEVPATPPRPSENGQEKDAAKEKEPEKSAEKAKEKGAEEAQPKAKAAAPKAPEGDALWLAWNDRVMGGRAFLPFKPFDHPTLGAVEIGGWRPGVRLNPPIEQVAPITEAQLSFLADLAGKMPKLVVSPLKIVAKGGGLFEVSTTVENPGYFPTALAQGVRTRKALPVLARLDPGGAKVLAGKSLERINSLAGSGGRQELRWLLLDTTGAARIKLEVTCPKAGRASLEAPLKAE